MHTCIVLDETTRYDYSRIYLLKSLHLNLCVNSDQLIHMHSVKNIPVAAGCSP